MRNLHWMSNLSLLFLMLMLIIGCKKEPCFDIPELDKQSLITKEWVVNDNIGRQKITDKNGISQTFIPSSRSSHFVENSVSDDCGNNYGSSSFSIQYNMSLSPLHFSIDIYASEFSHGGFHLDLRITNTKNVESKATTYDFITKTSRENNSTIEHIEQITFLNKTYRDVLKITFDKVFSINDVRTVYYAKGYGVIKFTAESGNEFEIN